MLLETKTLAAGSVDCPDLVVADPALISLSSRDTAPGTVVTAQCAPGYYVQGI